MRMRINLKSPNDTWSGPVAIGDGESIGFTNGVAHFESEDKKAPFPTGGRLRRVNAGLVATFGRGRHTIDGREPTD